jgi:hypothetical protein
MTNQIALIESDNASRALPRPKRAKHFYALTSSEAVSPALSDCVLPTVARAQHSVHSISERENRPLDPPRASPEIADKDRSQITNLSFALPFFFFERANTSRTATFHPPPHPSSLTTQPNLVPSLTPVAVTPLPSFLPHLTQTPRNTASALRRRTPEETHPAATTVFLYCRCLH